VGGVDLTIAMVFEKLWAAIFVYVFWKGREISKENKHRDTAITNLQIAEAKSITSFITDTQMKDAVREALIPYKEGQQEIKALLSGLNEHIFTLSKEVAVQGAIANDK